MASTPPVSLSGLASGLDTTSIVDALMQIERQPEVRLQTTQAQVKQKQSVLRDFQTKLNSLKLAADAFESPGLFADTQSLDTSDSSAITATRISGAGVGGSQVVVQRLASSQQRTYDYTPNATSDTVLDFGNGTPQLTVTAGTDIDTLVSNINSSSTLPVYAASITDPNDPTGAHKLLVLSSKTPGEGGDFSVQAGSTIGLAEDTRKAKTHAAFGAQQTLTYTPPAGASSITVNGTAVTLNAGDDVNAAAADINSASVGVTASVDKYNHLVVTSNTTGSASSLAVSGADVSLYSSSAGKDVATTQNLDAAYTVDGGSVQYAKSNIVDDAVPGIELTFKAASTNAVTITVGSPAPDHDAIKGAVKSFVSAYNDVVDFINKNVNEQAVVNPQTTSDQLKGLFFGDPLMTGVQSRLRIAMTSTVGTNPSLNMFSEIGISTGDTTGSGTLNQDSVDGKLTLDESKLDSMLDTNPLDVKSMLGAATGSTGLGQILDGVLDPEVGAGLDLDQQLSSMDSQLRDIADQMADMDINLQATQDRLKSQFTAMETALSQSQSQQQWLAGQIAGLPVG